MSHSHQQPPPRQQQPVTPFREASWLRQHQHEGKQFQSRDKQARTPDLQDPESGHPVAGNQPEAIDNPAGAARPVYDQYELKSPQNMHHDEADDARRDQARSQDGCASGQPSDNPEGVARNADGSKASGYAGSDDDQTTVKPDTTEKDVTDEEDGIDEEPDNKNSERGYG